MPSRPLARALASALVAVTALAGCTASKSAVDQSAGSQYGFVRGQGSGEVVAVGKRKRMPALRGELLDGTAWSSERGTGRVVVYNVWGSWCTPCQAEAADLQQVYEQTKALGVDFVGIDVRDGRSAARAFERRHEITYPSLYDRAGRVVVRMRAAPPRAIPSTVVVDRTGRVAAVFPLPVLARTLAPVVRRVATERR